MLLKMVLHRILFVQIQLLCLQSIKKGECPRELEPADRGTQVHVNLVKKDEEWEVSPDNVYFSRKQTHLNRHLDLIVNELC